MLRDEALVPLCGLRCLVLVPDEVFVAELHEGDLVRARGYKSSKLFQDLGRRVRVHLLPVLLVLLEEHVFKDVQ